MPAGAAPKAMVLGSMEFTMRLFFLAENRSIVVFMPFMAVAIGSLIAPWRVRC